MTLTPDTMSERFNDCMRRYQGMTEEQVGEIHNLCFSFISAYVRSSPLPLFVELNAGAALSTAMQMGLLQGMIYTALYGVPDFLKPMLTEEVKDERTG